MKKKINYILLFLILTGCVEHVFLIDINPQGNFNITYECQGDKEDIYNYDFFIPNSPDWEINTLTNKNDNYIFIAQKKFLINEIIPNNFMMIDSIPYSSTLKHPISITKKNYYFFETINFECTFENRQVENKYPILKEWIKNPETDGIAIEVYKYIIEQTINDLNLNFNIFPIVNNNFNDWFIKNINHLSDTILIKNFDIQESQMNNYISIIAILLII